MELQSRMLLYRLKSSSCQFGSMTNDVGRKRRYLVYGWTNKLESFKGAWPSFRRNIKICHAPELTKTQLQAIAVKSAFSKDLYIVHARKKGSDKAPIEVSETGNVRFQNRNTPCLFCGIIRQPCLYPAFRKICHKCVRKHH